MDTIGFLDTILEDVRTWFPAVLLFILLLADTASTNLFLRMGGMEANPNFARFNILGLVPVENWFGRVAIAGGFALLFGLAERALKSGVKLTNRLLVQVVSLLGWWTLFIEALTVLWNLTLLL